MASCSLGKQTSVCSFFLRFDPIIFMIIALCRPLEFYRCWRLRCHDLAHPNRLGSTTIWLVNGGCLAARICPSAEVMQPNALNPSSLDLLSIILLPTVSFQRSSKSLAVVVHTHASNRTSQPATLHLSKKIADISINS